MLVLQIGPGEGVRPVMLKQVLRVLPCRVLFAALVWLVCLLPGLASAQSDTLRLQLGWLHQSQFAGVYMALARRHFEAEGLKLELIEGGPGISPIQSLQRGDTDLAIAWLDTARAAGPGPQAVNIAQIFSGSALILVCHMRSGILIPQDIAGREIGTWNIGDDAFVRQLLERLGVPADSLRFVQQRPDGADLIDGTLPCATAMTYNEYLKILAAGVDPSELLVLDPDTLGLPHIEDGVYVLRERLADPAFHAAVSGFVRALRKGWHEARIAPTLALESVLRMNPGLQRDHQQQMLESILNVIPERSQFGYFDLARLDASAVPEGSGRADAIWTHSVWNALLEQEGRAQALTPATRYYAQSVLDMPAFKALFLIGILTFALAAALEGIAHGYDFYGRLVLAFLASLGGGTLRDLLIGEARQPLFFVADPTYPLGVLLIVMAASFMTMLRPDIHHTARFRSVKHWVDLVGFSVLAVGGATIAIAANMPWYWAPFCAAMTCAGGGVLRDIVINREPGTLKGLIYEEVAIVGGVLLMAGMWLANHFESSPTGVYLAIGISTLATGVLLFVVKRFGLRYPQGLGNLNAPDRVN